MKTKKLNSGIKRIIMSLIFISAFSYGYSTPKNKVKPALLIAGDVNDSDFPLKNVEIWVYEYNELINKIHTDDKGEFEVDLFKNKRYTLVFKNEGYQNKTISFNTFLPKETREDKAVFVFECSINLIKTLHLIKEYDVSYFPYAIVYFDLRKYRFTYCKQYVKNRESELATLQLKCIIDILAINNGVSNNKVLASALSDK